MRHLRVVSQEEQAGALQRPHRPGAPTPEHKLIRVENSYQAIGVKVKDSA